ncbi:hypothetical protein GW17_00049495 [Ensete ventricosum]|nr:hypothetical protein GW17_00049495 [Ensete ventricosum]
MVATSKGRRGVGAWIGQQREEKEEGSDKDLMSVMVSSRPMVSSCRKQWRLATTGIGNRRRRLSFGRARRRQREVGEVVTLGQIWQREIPTAEAGSVV